MRCDCYWSGGPEPIRKSNVICEAHGEQDIRAGMYQAQEEERMRTMRCQCLWRRSGLGAEVVKAWPECEVHGLGGPMQMLMKGEDVGRQAGMLKAKHDDQQDSRVRSYPVGDLYETVGRGDRAVGKAEVGGRVYGNTADPRHPESLGHERLNLREEARVSAALKIGAEQERKMSYTSEDRLIGTTETAGPADDRHVFSSGATSSGRKPNYLGMMPLHAYHRFAIHRGYGDEKHGEDNYMKGCRDRQFILDRINHGIEHLLKLAEQVKAGRATTVHQRGEDDAAAVMCAGMFVMCYQNAMDEDRKGTAMESSPSALNISPGVYDQMTEAASQVSKRMSGLNKVQRRPETEAIEDRGDDSGSYGHGV